MLRLLSIAMLVLIMTISVAADSSDPSNGATNFVFVPAGQLWHPIGSATQITTWSGPFDNAAHYPANVYITFWKEPATDESSRSLPYNVQIIHALNTDFYYPKNADPVLDPAQVGYTAGGFERANEILGAFPGINKLFPNGLTASGCHTSEQQQIFYLRENRSNDAYLVMWQPNKRAINVAYMPQKMLTGSFESVLSNVAYYANGGMAELVEFGSYFYYLSRVPQHPELNKTTAMNECPAIPVATEDGLSVPTGWTEALKNLN